MNDTATAPATDPRIPAWTLGWRLRRALSHAGIGAEEMATELGVNRATVSRWMNDHGAAPRAAFVKQWALRTGVPLEWLYADSGNDGAPHAAPAERTAHGANRHGAYPSVNPG